MYIYKYVYVYAYMFYVYAYKYIKNADLWILRLFIGI